MLFFLAKSTFMTSTFGTAATLVTGAKSLMGSYGRLANSHGLMACVATAPITSVKLSGSALADRSAALVPPDPDRFLTMIGWPNEARTFQALRRGVGSGGRNQRATGGG